MLTRIIIVTSALLKLVFIMPAQGKEVPPHFFHTKSVYRHDLSFVDDRFSFRIPPSALSMLSNGLSDRLSSIKVGVSLRPPDTHYRYKLAKKKKNDHINLLDVWINSDLTRLFSPNLKNSGHIGLTFHYSLRRSPHLFLHYDRLKIKTKVDRRGLVLNDIRYDLGLENSVFGLKLKNSDPRLYFRYRF